VKAGSLEDSLKQFVAGEKLEGDNSYFCEKCNEKVRYEKLTKRSSTKIQQFFHCRAKMFLSECVNA